MTTLTVTIDRDPRSLSLDADESDLVQFAIELEDEISRRHPELNVRVVTGAVLGFTASDPSLDREISSIWLATASELGLGYPVRYETDIYLSSEREPRKHGRWTREESVEIAQRLADKAQMTARIERYLSGAAYVAPRQAA